MNNNELNRYLYMRFVYNVDDEGLNVRNHPSTSGKIVDVIEYGNI